MGIDQQGVLELLANWPLITGFVIGLVTNKVSDVVSIVMGDGYTLKIGYFLKSPKDMMNSIFFHHTWQFQVRRKIEKLFTSWVERDLNSYIAFWSQTCLKYSPVGAEGLVDIEASFKEKTAKYSSIEVKKLIFESFEMHAGHPVVTVNYEFRLFNQLNKTLVLEHCKETYTFARTSQGWLVVANQDMSNVVGK